MNKEEIEVIEKLKKYMQDNIDSGYHKFIYNEYEEDKCIDIINVIDKLQKENEELKEKNKALEKYYIKWVEERPSLIHEDKIRELREIDNIDYLQFKLKELLGGDIE